MKIQMKSLNKQLIESDAKKKSPRSTQQIHANHSCEVQEVHSGPHLARIYCCFCKKHVQWAKDYEYRYFRDNIKRPMVLRDLQTQLHFNAHKTWAPRYYQTTEQIKDYYSNSGEDDFRSHSDYLENYRNYE